MFNNQLINKRIYIIDQIRGFAIICMVIYHLIYDITIIFNVDILLFYSDLMNFIRDMFAGLFIFISGVACNLSKNNFKRGVICLSIALLMTAFTYFFIPSQTIVFGILHLLGISMILYSIFKKNILKCKNDKLVIVILLILLVFLYNIIYGFIGIRYILEFPIPNFLSQYEFLFPFGIKSDNFFSSDYFPLIPWSLIFFIGCFVGKYFNKSNINPKLYKNYFPFLSIIGKNTIWIYILHQPILYAILNLIKGWTN